MSCNRYSKSMYSKAMSRRAFSLMEMLVVIVILGMLAGLVVLKTRSYLVLSKQNAARVEISKICQAIETFYAVYDRYPSNDEGIEILAQPSEKLADKILSKVPRDPWGNPYEYNNPGRTGPYDVICFGADGREGGEGANTDFTNEDDDEERSM